MLEELNISVGAYLRGRSAKKGMECGVEGLGVFESFQPSPIEATLYQPIACLTLQGVKETTIGSTTHRFTPGDAIIVSHDLPVTSQIVEASRLKPYRCLVLELNLSVARSLQEQIGLPSGDDVQGTAIEVGEACDGFVEAMERYFKLSENPVDAQVLGPLVYKELHYRLLMSPQGRTLRKLLSLDSHASRIAKAIEHIRKNYQHHIPVPDLAQIAGMSASSFHAHFKAVTETSPLQYQKDLRLIEARRLLAEEGQAVSATAFDVGYESATQFSRDYARKFGASPRNDLAAMAGR